MTSTSRQTLFIPEHFHAICYRRFIMIKRSITSVIGSSIATLVFSAISIVVYYLMAVIMKDSVKPITYSSYETISNKFYTVVDPSNPIIASQLGMILNNSFIKDTGRIPQIMEFGNRDIANKYVFDHIKNKTEPQIINMGLGFNPNDLDHQGNETGYNINIFYNQSQTKSYLVSYTMLLKHLWKNSFGSENELNISSTFMYERFHGKVYSHIAPVMITLGLLSFVPIFMTQLIIEVNGDIRPFMISCTMNLFSFWAATFLIDLIFWLVTVSMIWGVFVAFGISAVLDNMLNVWYVLAMQGPSYILSCYCLSFAFKSVEGASRQSFFILCAMVIAPMMVDMVRDGAMNSLGVDILYGAFPQVNIERLLINIMERIAIMKKPLKFYFEEKYSKIQIFMQFVNIPLYGILLWIIEKVRIVISKRIAKEQFNDFSEYFKNSKTRHPVTEESKTMEDQVNDSSNKWAIRINNVSRLFFNTSGDPIAAVNSVSLGIKQGSMFGFLGANGSGKTTLMKMITSLLPISNGNIEIDGVDISETITSTSISICPQFNTHLCEEMTPNEHFKLYSLLFRLSDEESHQKTQSLKDILQLNSIQDTVIRELSDGDVRKLAIGLSFLGPASIILLDEPTATLDPLSRKHVHDLISSYKGQKTMMLCTHLLSEAESLCDMISIMIKGNVYTCGSPQYLSEKFGKEFRVEVGILDESEISQDKCTQFFNRNLPTAKLSIQNPRARIYNIPTSDILLHDLYKTISLGRGIENGYQFFTCSSSSLERVFMEIVKLSENNEEIKTAHESEGDNEIITP